MHAAAPRRFRPTKCQGDRVRWNKGIEPADLTMHPSRVLQLCALPIPLTLALILLLGPACAQAPEQAKDETPVELPADEPLDLSTPEPDADTLKAPTPFAVKPSAPDWNGKAGIDYSKPSIPAVTFQPDQLLAGTVPDQSSRVAWAT